MNKTLTLVLTCGVLALGVVGCGNAEDNPDDQAVDTTRAKSTEGGTYYVEYAPSPDPIPHNELFSLDVSVWESEAMQTRVSGATIAVEATMPAHGHGMTTEPSVTNDEDGTFTVDGMKFHMQSDTPEEKWVIDVSVSADGTTETASFDVMCCGE